MSSPRQALAATVLLGALSSDELDRILEIGRIEHFPTGGLVLAEGEKGPRLLVVLEGEVEVHRRDAAGIDRSLGVVGAGEVLGEISLLLDLPRTASVRARSPLKCFAMDRGAFQEMVEAGDPAAYKLGLQLARSLAARLLDLNDRVVDLLGSTDGTLPDQFHAQRQSVFRLWADR